MTASIESTRLATESVRHAANLARTLTDLLDNVASGIHVGALDSDDTALSLREARDDAGELFALVSGLMRDAIELRDGA